MQRSKWRGEEGEDRTSSRQLLENVEPPLLHVPKKADAFVCGQAMSRRKQNKPQHLLSEDGESGVPSQSLASVEQTGQNYLAPVEQSVHPTDQPASDPGDRLSPTDRTGSLSDSQLLNCLQKRNRHTKKLRRYGVNGERVSDLFDRTCRYCGVLRNSPADLRRHLRKHTGERPFVCSICKRAFKAKRSLQYHQYMHHGIQFKNTNISANLSPSWKNRLKEDNPRVSNSGWLRSSPSVSSQDFLDDSSHSAPEMKESHGFVNHCRVISTECLDSSTYHLQNESQDTGIESNGEEHLSPASREVCLDKHPHHAHSFKPISAHNSPEDNSADDTARQDESPGPSPDETEEEKSNMQLSKRTCQFCNKVCPKPSDLKRHLMVHTGERPFKCDTCGKAFKAKGSMQYHQKAAHGANIELSQGLEERYLRLKHRSGPVQNQKEPAENDMPLNLHKSVENTQCEKQGPDKILKPDETLSEDMCVVPLHQSPGHPYPGENRSPQTGRNGMCKTDTCCTTALDSRPTILGDSEIRHGSDDEEDFDPELSKQLDKEIIVKEESHFVKNRISIKNETVLVTRLDGVNLISGVRTSLYKCHMCGKMFNYLSRLQCHLSVHFERHMTTYQCAICGANFKFKTQLLRHSRLHDRADVLTKQYSEGTCNSPKEGRILSTPSSLSEGHGDLEECDLKEGEEEDVDPVDDNTETSQDLGNGALFHYSNRSSHRYNKVNGCYSCLFCKKTFFRLFSLQRHERMHTGVKPCYCKECGKGFSEPRNLRQHILRFHNDGFQMDFVRKARKRAIIASLRSSARAMRAVDLSVNSEPQNLSRSGADANDSVTTVDTAKQEFPRNGGTTISLNAKELLQKEDFKDDVTVVIPADVPVEKECCGQSQNSSSVSETSWSETLSEQDRDEYMNTEIMAAPKRPLLSFRKESTGCKSRRKSSVPVKIENMSPPHQTGTQDPSDMATKVSPELTKAVVKEEPMSPLAQLPITSGVPITPMSPVLFSNSMGMGQSATHPLFLSSHLLPSSGISVNPVMSIPITVQVPVDPQAAATSSSSPGMGLMAQVSPNDFLVGYPRVKWDGNPLAGIPNSEPLPRRRSLPSESSYTIHNSAYTVDKNGISTDGRKVTSLSRTHSRLHMHPPYANSSTACSTVTGFYSRLHVVNAPVNREKVCKPMLLPDGRSIYRCVFCNKDFPTYSDINRHMDFHEDIRPYKCKFCDYYARTNSQLKVHMMRHQGIREFCCKLCNYKGVTQSDLNRHMKSQIHMLKSRNECPNCLEGFVTPKNLERHMVEICQGRNRADKAT